MTAELKDQIAGDVTAAVADLAVRARAVTGGTVLRGGTPAEFAAVIEVQRAKIAAIHQGTQKKPAQ